MTSPEEPAARPDPAGGGREGDRREARTSRRRRPAGERRDPAGGSAASTKTEVSAGGVVYRRVDGEIEVVLASRRTRRGDIAWGLAKGGIEPDETAEQAAVREVREETGLEARIERSLGRTRYIYVWDDVRIRKTVHFFLMRATGAGDVDDRDDEMEDVRWFPLDRALKRAAYRGEREVLGRAASVLRGRRRPRPRTRRRRRPTAPPA